MRSKVTELSMYLDVLITYLTFALKANKKSQSQELTQKLRPIELVGNTKVALLNYEIVPLRQEVYARSTQTGNKDLATKT